MGTFNDTSLERLQNYDGSCIHGGYEITKEWTHIGVYLLVAKNGTFKTLTLSSLNSI